MNTDVVGRSQDRSGVGEAVGETRTIENTSGSPIIQCRLCFDRSCLTAARDARGARPVFIAPDASSDVCV